MRSTRGDGRPWCTLSRHVVRASHHLGRAAGLGQGALGRPVPELWVTKDQVPNALSMRSSSRRVVCTTSGVALLSCDRLEATPAHELGHVWAQDAGHR